MPKNFILVLLLWFAMLFAYYTYDIIRDFRSIPDEPPQGQWTVWRKLDSKSEGPIEVLTFKNGHFRISRWVGPVSCSPELLKEIEEDDARSKAERWK